MTKPNDSATLGTTSKRITELQNEEIKTTISSAKKSSFCIFNEEEEKNGKIEAVEKELAKEEKKKAEDRFNPKILQIQKETISERGEKENEDRKNK